MFLKKLIEDQVKRTTITHLIVGAVTWGCIIGYYKFGYVPPEFVKAVTKYGWWGAVVVPLFWKHISAFITALILAVQRPFDTDRDPYTPDVANITNGITGKNGPIIIYGYVFPLLANPLTLLYMWRVKFGLKMDDKLIDKDVGMIEWGAMHKMMGSVPRIPENDEIRLLEKWHVNGDDC